MSDDFYQARLVALEKKVKELEDRAPQYTLLTFFVVYSMWTYLCFTPGFLDWWWKIVGGK